MAMPLASADSLTSIRFEWFGNAGPASGRVPRFAIAPGIRCSTYEKSSLPMTGCRISCVRSTPSSSRAVSSTNPAKRVSFTVTGYPRISSTLTSAPCAAATPSATRRTPASIASRVASDTVRTVPSRFAVSGMTLRVVPASILAMVRTAGSNTLTRRVTSVWKACTISQAIGIGSRQSCGAEAWPPLPRTTIWIVSPEAIVGPGRVAITPAA
jgi:hypothetical protein